MRWAGLIDVSAVQGVRSAETRFLIAGVTPTASHILPPYSG
jgi:hypothetical protein